MLENRIFLIKLAIVVLLVALASPAFAELKSSYTAAGNNCGLVVHTNNYGGPLTDSNHQFPAGTGNFYSAGRWNWGVHVATDRNGDGVVNDTLCILSRGGNVTGGVNSLEALELITALGTSGENMGEASSRLENNRLYVSTDADDMADWPPEFREGRSASGAPIIHGAETIASRFGDCFVEDGIGQSVEYQFYFLNFGESNNMVYLHIFFRNMSEYVKWHPNPDVSASVANTPDGQIWYGMEQFYCTANGFRIGGRDEAWAYNFPRQIIVQADRDGSEGGFSGHPAAMAYYQRRNPSLRDETLKLTNTCAQGWNTEFGFYPEEPMESGYPVQKCYRYGLGRNAPAGPFYAESTSPFNGKPLDGWPGVLEPEDDRYEQWIWGERNANNNYNYWSELHDVAPRDSFSLDGVIMFMHLDPPNFGFPSSQDLNNIDDPDVQAALAPILDYADVADIVAEGGFILPETPTAPPLVIIPGDRAVSITWSDINVHTPDAYYGFLQDNPELDPDGIYREYDFEGYRLYRSFVGPNDTHSEMIFTCSVGAGDLTFFYNDIYTKDEPFNRMRNGMKVWYALVPYDRNYDPVSGDELSLPDPSSGKSWNRPGGGLYTVEPRSEAGEFKPASLLGISYVGSATVPDLYVELAGDGTGKLTEAPKYLQPQLDITFEVVNNERITQDFTIYVLCSEVEIAYDGCNWPVAAPVFQLTDASGNVIQEADAFMAASSAELLFTDIPDDDGLKYAVHTSWNPGDGVNVHLDAGGYTGAATIWQWTGRCPWGYGITQGMKPTIAAWINNGLYELTWRADGDDMTLDVVDKATGAAIPFSPYPDDRQWGFMPGGTYMDFYNEVMDGVPQADRENLMLEKLPASNTERFGIWINGVVWEVSPDEIVEPLDEMEYTGELTMPVAGNVFTVSNVWGSWNSDKTVFTQWSGPPLPGDKWQIDIKASSMDPEDADLSKVMVVPNPYIASSWLDLSPDSRRVEFVNLPARCTIRIYSLGGHLVNVLNHIGANRFGWGDYTDWDRLDPDNNPREFTGYDNHSGTEPWNLRNRFGQTVASGLYFYHVTDTRGEDYTGKFYIIN